MAVNGILASYQHRENGMTMEDMTACGRVATQSQEVIIFRSTGPWSQRWIQRNYPTKNFHVKGKSSDWGPQAGFVPYLGKYSKVGGDAEKEKIGTKYNDDGIHHSYAKKTQLCLTFEELNVQFRELAAGRTALAEMHRLAQNGDYILYANRSSDGARFAFRAVWTPTKNHYKIFVFDKAVLLRVQAFEIPKSLEVMTSSEVGANDRPMTGDYDLMTVCPTWKDYGERSAATISKPGLDFGRGGLREPGQNFAAGTNLDAAVDPRLSTGLPNQMTAAGKPKTFGARGFTAPQYGGVVNATREMSSEHPDMGNLTPRILRCINDLNMAMGQTGAFRRVHHNAESHRNLIFGGITADDMGRGEAFPLTVFQPDGLRMAGYESVHTLENLGEFKTYATALHNAGYFVPRNWTWHMSIRDQRFPDLQRVVGKKVEELRGK